MSQTDGRTDRQWTDRQWTDNAAAVTANASRDKLKTLSPLEEGKGAVGGGFGAVQKCTGEFGVLILSALYIVTFLLSLRVSDILPFLCFSTPHFPHPNLQSPQNFLMSPWE